MNTFPLSWNAYLFSISLWKSVHLEYQDNKFSTLTLQIIMVARDTYETYYEL
jgi:hypothetical protein